MSYDATREPREFVGEDRESALAKATDFYGVSVEELTVKDLAPGEVHGLAARTALVAIPTAQIGAAAPRRREERGDRDRDRDRDRGGRGDRDRGRGGRGGRDRDRDRDRDRGDRGDRGGRGRGGRGRRQEAAEAEPLMDEPTEPSVGTADGDLGEVGQMLLGTLERMELGPFTIRENREDDMIVFQIAGDAAPRLAGSDGRTVDALQLLANQAAGRVEEEPPRVVLDVEGDQEARSDRLEKLAQRAARRARDVGRTVRLDPMNGRDRRTIHVTLRDEDGVATMSVGEGAYRQVLVVPEGAPEYDDAMEEAERASDRD